MELTLYTRNYNAANSINNFMEFYYSLQMKYLASDLLKKGLSPKQISAAVVTAIKVASASGIETKEHFMPVYSAIGQEIIQDCKLSVLGYGLVLLNADPTIFAVGDFQVHVLTEFFKTCN